MSPATFSHNASPVSASTFPRQTTAAKPLSQVSSRLLNRLRGLDVAVLHVDASETVTASNQPAWFIERMVQAPAFAALIGQHRPGFVEAMTRSEGRDHWSGAEEPRVVETHPTMEGWPGLYLMPLNSTRPRATQSQARVESAKPALVFALILSTRFFESDQFRLVCSQCRLDPTSTLDRLERTQKRSPREAEQLARTVSWLAQDAAELRRSKSEIEGMTHELSESYEELSLLYKLSTSMRVNKWAGEFLTQACHELRQVLDLRWLSVQLIDDDPRLEDLAGQCFVDGQPRIDNHALASLGQTLLDRYGTALGPILIDDVDQLGLAQRPEVHGKLLVSPLQREGHTFGVVFGAEKDNGSILSSVDTNLASTLSVSMTIFLENRAVYEDTQAMFLGTLHALTSAIDAKDSYTHGHSERVALVSRMLAEAVGLDRQTVERVYLAGLVHDVGKIGVPESVLSKPGKLTDDEFDQIKRHPEIGGEILKDIRQMRDLLPGVLHHHERWDGRGYPHRLGGYDVPLFGRLIGLADAFDAMSSDRTYRSRMSREQVLEEIRRCRASQFDADLAEVFVNLDFSAYDQMIDKHAAILSR